MATYKTPNVYVEEISTFPPSVAEVSTAIPAFIGYTEKGEELINIPTRISSLLDYETLFGKAKATVITVTKNENGLVTTIEPTSFKYLMYYALRMYFDNGGGSCYIVSVGTYKQDNSLKKDDFVKGIKALEKEDEPTLIMLTDAVNLKESNDYYEICQKALKQCHKLKDRFVILDVLPNKTNNNSTGSDFRGAIGNEVDYLKYGAAYYPYLQTSINYYYTDDSVEVPFKQIKIGNENGLIIFYKDDSSRNPQVKIEEGSTAKFTFEVQTNTNNLNIKLPNSGDKKVTNLVKEWSEFGEKGEYQIVQFGDGNNNVSTLEETNLSKIWCYPQIDDDVADFIIVYKGDSSRNPQVKIEEGSTAKFTFEVQTNTNNLNIKLPNSGDKKVTNLVTAWSEFGEKGEYQIVQLGTGEETVPILTLSDISESTKLKDLKNFNTELYNKLKAEIAKKRVILPPSAAIAGVYARVDRDRGVWKAPANVSLASVIAPTVKITNEEQENLNVDPNGGKSINAIRSFSGKGTLVWGARTLAGNDNEWRYINVRRLFNLIEESINKAIAFVVFEPNTVITWLKVRTLIDSYLEGLWRQGALAGDTPAQAFFVNIGLGKSMTAQDILEGKMIVEIGIAAVRPAEYIILKFSQKLQEG